MAYWSLYSLLTIFEDSRSFGLQDRLPALRQVLQLERSGPQEGTGGLDVGPGVRESGRLPHQVLLLQGEFYDTQPDAAEPSEPLILLLDLQASFALSKTDQQPCRSRRTASSQKCVSCLEQPACIQLHGTV
jgi:hypothetical protein